MLNTIMKIRPPAPYEPGEPEFWNDPHISRQMLLAHLDQGTDAASYRNGRIDAICAYLPQAMGLAPGSALIDLGCGPGLYSRRLAAAGYRVMGMDLSPTSIEYARRESAVPGAQYRVGNYLHWEEIERYDAALLIYEDYGVLAPADRRTLLANIHRALVPGGRFALDVCGIGAFETRAAQPARAWHAEEAGFWRPHPHLVLQERFLYPDIPAACEQYIVCDGEVKVFRVHQTYYTPRSIADELGAAGFAVEQVLSSLAGEPWREGSGQIGVLCRKVG